MVSSYGYSQRLTGSHLLLNTAGSAEAAGLLVAVASLIALVVVGGIAQRLYGIVNDTMQGYGLLAWQRSKRTGFATEFPNPNGSTLRKEPAYKFEDLEGSDYTYPGLLNTSTTCYLNSTLQSLASSATFVAYLQSLVDSAGDVPLNVASTLLDLLSQINSPVKRSFVLRTAGLVQSLLNSSSNTAASRNRKRIMQGSGQQDAQEFFLILTEAVEEEKKLLFNEIERKRQDKAGFHQLLLPDVILQSLTSIGTDDMLKNPYAATMANRTSCMTCGYSEAIRHTPTEHLSLTVPQARSCSLTDMLADHVKLEVIDEFTCRRCSVFATQDKVRQQVDSVKLNSSVQAASSSKKKRQKELQRSLARLDAAIDAADFERNFADILPVKLERAVGPASKQAMYAMPPKALVIHLSRSSFGGYSAKNNCQVSFPEYLNLDPYTTIGPLLSKPNASMSMPQLREKGEMPKNVYRLCSLVVHFGSHSYGHYVTYRRRPTPVGALSKQASKDWFRISDETVQRATGAEMLTANPFLLFYERIDLRASSASGGESFSVFGRILHSWQTGSPPAHHGGDDTVPVSSSTSPIFTNHAQSQDP